MLKANQAWRCVPGSVRQPHAVYPRSIVLLVDDLLTTGGHLRAASAFLRDAGARGAA
jgi:predicted amidophosphoribosyltransferase